ncbi:hypothetical protein BGZ57DRAFT_918456 [Hyaloscypha finlandica]|nr:hypothetical protein BGZ57DRAFT_918456 [Hyaloscypha finlandica]
MLIQYANERAFRLRRRSDGNTPLHDLAHYRHCRTRPRRCYLKGCQKCSSPSSSVAKIFICTMKEVIKMYPEAINVPNAKGKTPYVIHLETRLEFHQGDKSWADLEYDTKLPPLDDQRVPNLAQPSAETDLVNGSGGTLLHDLASPIPPRTHVSSRGSDKMNNRNPERAERSAVKKSTTSGPRNTNEATDYSEMEQRALSETWTLDDEKRLAMEVSQLLLEECFSQESYDKATTSLFGAGKKAPGKHTTFRPQEALNYKTKEVHAFLPLHSILTLVEIGLTNDAPLNEIQQKRDSQRTTLVVQDRSPDKITNSIKREIRDINEKYLTDVMKWLRDTMRVKRILKLVVRDNQAWQCRDETIEDTIRGWGIRYLDWNKIDMAIDTVKNGGAEKVVELCLTSSGSNAALIGWSDEKEGFGIFPKLRTVEISVRPNLESIDRRIRCQGELRDRVQPRFKKLLVKFSPEDFSRFGPAGESSGTTGESGDAEGQPPHRWMKAISDFRLVMEKAAAQVNGDPNLKKRLEENKIKVALIDDGVNPQLLGQITCLRHGNGWPDEDPYYQSAEGHGTIMAKLILYMCPFVDLYVAKLDKSVENKLAENKPVENRSKYKSVADMAAQAIKWAVSQDVDIISMSWTIKRTDNDGADNLNREIETAGGTAQDIILFCAAENEGEYGSNNTLPASSKISTIKKIGSSNKEGKPSGKVKTDGFDFLFPSEGVLNEITHDLKENKRQGSSVSTALASGLAAMILWCSVVAGREKKYFRSKGRVATIFKTLESPEKFVDITKILDKLTNTLADSQDYVAIIEELDRILDEALGPRWERS